MSRFQSPTHGCPLHSRFPAHPLTASAARATGANLFTRIRAPGKVNRITRTAWHASRSASREATAASGTSRRRGGRGRVAFGVQWGPRRRTRGEGLVVYIPCPNGVTAIKVSTKAPYLKRLWTDNDGAAGGPIIADGLLWTIGGDNAVHGLDPAIREVRRVTPIPQTVERAGAGRVPYSGATRPPRLATRMVGAQSPRVSSRRMARRAR